jgi:hypothetical protein
VHRGYVREFNCGDHPKFEVLSLIVVLHPSNSLAQGRRLCLLNARNGRAV